jgi:hypothetical protein
VAVVATLHDHETRLNLDLGVQQLEEGIPVASVEDVIGAVGKFNSRALS